MITFLSRRNESQRQEEKMEPGKEPVYQSDLTDEAWKIIFSLFPEPKSGPGKPGRPASDLRRIVNGILYVNRTGCQRRMLPKEFGPRSTVYGYFRKWSKADLWENIMNALRKRERKRQGREEEPSAGSVDSQSVKSGLQGCAVGFDGGKMVKGRKRHIFADTLGIILAVIVTPANEGERNGLKKLMKNYFGKGALRLRKIWVDAGYSGSPLRQRAETLSEDFRVDLEMTENKGKGFNVVRKRRVAERTFARIFNFRRNSKDYEVLTENGEAMIQISMISILVRRSAQQGF